MSSDTISEKWSDRFKFFNRYGLPGTVSYRAALKELGFSKKIRINCNLYGFFFGFLYFCILGLWKKGLALLLAVMIINIIIAIVEIMADINLELLSRIINLGYSCLCSMSVNSAYYLQLVKGIDSWNPLQGMKRESADRLSRQ